MASIEHYSGIYLRSPGTTFLLKEKSMVTTTTKQTQVPVSQRLSEVTQFCNFAYRIYCSVGLSLNN